MNPVPVAEPVAPAPPIKKQHTILRALISAGAVLLLSAVGILYGHRVTDHIKAQSSQPSAQVVAAADRLALTDRGHDIFYATQPAVEDKKQFNSSCNSQERTAAIIGCYYKDTIHLFDVKNAKLDGTLEVTAAHEMLHAAYQRLNWFERRKVDAMVMAQYAKLKDDEDLKEIMKYYSQAEPGAEINELHSIIGTTVVALDPGLEQYYGQYFTNRPAVVTLNAAYNKVFGDLKEQAAGLEARITSDGPALHTDLDAYEAERQQLELDIESFNQQAYSGSFTPRTLDATRSALLARVDALDVRRVSVNDRVAAYNADVATLNALSVQVSDLYKSINGAEAAQGV